MRYDQGTHPTPACQVETAFPAPGTPPAAGRPRGQNKLGFRFDTVPRFVADWVRDGKLLPADQRVIQIILRYRYAPARSCWVTKATVAKELGTTARTVQYSLARLQQAGVVNHHRVKGPAKDDPRNRTGWQFDFPWLDTPDGKPVPLEEQPVSPPEEKSIAPLEEKPVALQEEKSVAPNSDSVNRDSSSSQPPPVQTETETKTDDDELRRQQNLEAGRAADAARREFPQTDLAGTIEADRQRLSKTLGGRWDCLTAAIAMAACRKTPPRSLFGWIRTTAADFAANGISAEARQAVERRQKVHAAKTQAPPPQPRPRAVEDTAWLLAVSRDPNHPDHARAVAKLAEEVEAALAVRDNKNLPFFQKNVTDFLAEAGIS